MDRNPQPGTILQRAENADADTVLEAIREVAHYHSPTPSQLDRHKMLADALEEFIHAIIDAANSSLERSTAIAKAREAKMWASAAISVNEEGL